MNGLVRIFLLMLTLCVGPCADAAPSSHSLTVEKRHHLHIGLIDYYPLFNGRGQQPEGLIYEYMRDILRSVDLPLHYAGVSINRAVEQLRSHQLDLVVSLFKNAERSRFVQYSHQPLLSLSHGFCTLSPVRQVLLNARSRVAFLQGTVVPEGLDHMIQTPVTGENSQVRMLQMMVKGRVDAVQTPVPAALILAAHRAKLNINLVCHELKDSRRPVYLAFSKSVPRGIIQKMDEALIRRLETEDFDSFLKRKFQEAGLTPPDVEVIDPTDRQATR